MEIGSEISNKIRSAIRAKLMDLGSYVDNELPDYIMVMVANKKTKEQMSDDLSLFLGKNTDRFTSWLDNLLKKLQSISADNEVLESDLKHFDPPAPEEKPKSKESTTQTTPRKTPPSKKDQKDAQAKKEAPGHKGSDSRKGPSTRGKSKPNDEIKITAENEDLDDKSGSSRRPRETRSSKSLDQLPERPSKTASLVTVPERSSITRSHSSRHGRELVTGTMAADREESLRAGARITRGQADVRANSRPVASSTRKPASSLSSVIGKVDLQLNEEEEEYDPYHPSVGKVASTVKVSKKSAVPPSRQANKSLLMKAVRDSTKSAEQAAKKDVGAPLRKLEEKEPPPDQQSLQSQRMLRKRPNASLQIKIPVQIQSKPAPPSQPLTSRSRREEILREFKERIKGEEEEQQRYEEYTPEDVQDIRVFKQRNTSDFQYLELNPNEDFSKGGEEEFVVQETEEYVPLPEQTQTAVMSQADLNQRMIQGQYPSLPEPVRPEVDIVEADDEEFEDEDIEAGFEEFNQILQNREYVMPERPISPRFFVTLDGVDPDKLSQEAAMEVEDDFPSIAMLQSKENSNYRNSHLYPNAYRDLNRNPYRDPNSNTYRDPNPGMRYRDMSVGNYDSDSEGEMEMENNSSPVKRPKMLFPTERCRFWPSCKNGASCTFHHPTTQCKAFPKCRFGDKCRFIHPNCKFDASCSNPSCPYTHASHRNPLAMAASMAAHQALSLASPAIMMHQAAPPLLPPPPPAGMTPGSPDKVTCRFFPLCKNMNCPFSHPKPCRYGISCTNKGACRFHHPELPSRAKLKWTSVSALPSPPLSGSSQTLREKFILTPDDLRN
ncbi:zinc finger CCCH domain-containing protein 14-like isoform X2 [Lineus longissimus]|uniref:zinc finger CCCH domain-containing protein 14-like isoform X2 n=1 Tax=Lineus longissimus TaxID=88925 RepID=UPI002B4F9B12